MASGRPTILTEEIKNKADQYIQECIDEELEFHKTRSDNSNSYERLIKVRLPTVEGLAVYLGIARSTIYKWRDENEEFSDIIDRLLEKQADMLITKGLSGDYNTTIAKVLLTKHGYREGSEITGKDGAALTITFDEAFKDK